MLFQIFRCSLHIVTCHLFCGLKQNYHKLWPSQELKSHEKLVEEAWGLDSGKEIYYEGLEQRPLCHLHFGRTREETILCMVLSLLAAEDTSPWTRFSEMCGWGSSGWVCLHKQGVFELCFKKQHEVAWWPSPTLLHLKVVFAWLSNKGGVFYLLWRNKTTCHWQKPYSPRSDVKQLPSNDCDTS